MARDFRCSVAGKSLSLGLTLMVAGTRSGFDPGDKLGVQVSAEAADLRNWCFTGTTAFGGP